MPENGPILDRRSFLKASGAVIVGAGSSGTGLVTSPVVAAPAGEIAVTHGVAVGDVTGPRERSSGSASGTTGRLPSMRARGR